MRRLDVELSEEELTALLSDYSPDVLHYGRATIVDDRVSRLVRDYAAARKDLEVFDRNYREACAMMDAKDETLACLGEHCTTLEALAGDSNVNQVRADRLAAALEEACDIAERHGEFCDWPFGSEKLTRIAELRALADGGEEGEK